MKLRMELWKNSYDIVIENGALARVGEIFNLNRRVMVVTEPGVPRVYAESVLRACKNGFLHICKGGEDGKSMEEMISVLHAMMQAEFTRGDCVVAVGGGVIGDLAGFAASCYMRGIDFYNLPTTLLSQVDSSIGGKTGVNFDGVKNPIGAFHQPQAVLVDPSLLSTLPPRQLSNGMAEVIKMAMTFDAALVWDLEQKEQLKISEELIYRALQIKKMVVEQDERESGLRRVLNFGHTIGHGIEGLGRGEYHGECVALGMLPMCGNREIRQRLCALLQKAGLPTSFAGDTEAVLDLVMHDKKRVADKVMAVKVEEIGSYTLCEMTRAELKDAMRETFGL